MDDIQRRFTIKQIHKYHEQAQDLNKQARMQGWFAYGCLALSFICLNTKMQGVDVASWTHRLIDIYAWAGIAFGIDNLRKMIGIMSEKAGLDNMVSSLEFQVERAELENVEESEGPRL